MYIYSEKAYEVSSTTWILNIIWGNGLCNTDVSVTGIFVEGLKLFGNLMMSYAMLKHFHFITL